MRFHVLEGTFEKLPTDVSITTLGLILTKLWQSEAIEQKSIYNSELNLYLILFKRKENVWFPCFSTREDLSIDVSITNVGLILTKLW